MRKVRTEYDSRVDALVAVSKRLSVYEGRNKMESEVFFDRFVKGQTEDSEEFVEWANDLTFCVPGAHIVDVEIE